MKTLSFHIRRLYWAILQQLLHVSCTFSFSSFARFRRNFVYLTSKHFKEKMLQPKRKTLLTTED